MSRTVVLVLAGGTSRRFGSDKLNADLAGRTVLDVTLDSIPADLAVVVVGPERLVRRPVRFVREDPPGGGPAAGLVAGLVAALEQDADAVVSLPGDAPGAGAAVPVLLEALGPAELAVAVGADGRLFPLQLACTPTGARAVLAAAGDDRGAGASVRRLLEPLEPAHVVVEESALLDVDTQGDLDRIGLDRIGRDPTA